MTTIKSLHINQNIARDNFESLIHQLMERFVKQTPDDELKFINELLDILSKQESVCACVVIYIKKNDDLGFIYSKKGNRNEWAQLFQSRIGKQIKDAIFQAAHTSWSLPEDSSFRRNTSDPKLFAIPLREGPFPATFIFVPSSVESTSFINSLAKTASMCASFGLSTLAKAREKGYRQMASRIAQMTSSSILLAQLRIGEMARQHNTKDSKPKELVEGLNAISSDLCEAQEGFNRAMLFDIPQSQQAEEIELSDFLLKLIGELNSATSDRAAKYQPLDSKIHVNVSHVRLRYALRDIILNTWLLTEKKQPVVVSLSSIDSMVHITIDGGKSIENLRVLSSEKLKHTLCDPELFLITKNSEFPGERALGYKLAWVIIEEQMGGKIFPSIEKKYEGLCFNIALPIWNDN